MKCNVKLQMLQFFKGLQAAVHILRRAAYVWKKGGMFMERLMEKKGAAGNLMKGLVLTFLVTVVLLFGLAFLLLKLRLDVGKTEIGILATYVLSCFAGGWYCGHKAGRKRFLWGAAVGTLYFLILFLISGMSDRPFQSGLTESLTAFALCAGAGMLGGMVS